MHPHAWQPPTDLYETEDSYTIRIEIAGMNEEDFSVHYAENHISIYGKRQPFNPKCAYHRLEIPFGEFSTTIQIPENIDIEKASADYENGFLTIHIPKYKAIDIHINSPEE